MLNQRYRLTRGDKGGGMEENDVKRRATEAEATVGVGIDSGGGSVVDAATARR